VGQRLEPTEKQWYDLDVIVRNVETIVADAPPVNSLLGMNAFAATQINHRIEPSGVSRLMQLRTDSNATTFSALKPHPDTITAILPGVESLGSNRAERTSRLLSRLTELPAYDWLRAQKGYPDAVRTLVRLGKTDAAFALDTAEILLIRSLIFPLQILLVLRRSGSVPPYPAKRELEDVYRNVRDLVRFLRERWPIHGIVKIPPHLKSALRELEKNLNAKRRAYRKPKNDGTLIERDFRDQVIQRLNTEFGKCSATLVSHLLKVADYSHDRRDLKRQINALLG